MLCSEYMIRDYETGELIRDGFATCNEAVRAMEDDLEFVTGILDGDEILIGFPEDFA